MRIHIIFFIVAIICSIDSLKAQKTDKILVTDGDWMTGEIKKLDYGKVTFKTNAAGTINVKWENIYMMHSDKFFEVWLSR